MKKTKRKKPNPVKSLYEKPKIKEIRINAFLNDNKKIGVATVTSGCGCCAGCY